MVERGVNQQGELLLLPPGFRFHPTDEEVITSYLLQKFLNPSSFAPRAIGEVNLNKCEPWDLPSKAKMTGEKDEWYFFCHKDMKYPTGTRTNRATKEGYWKATGKDREIFDSNSGRELVGMKKTLVFYTGRAPRGSKTNWVMHEFRLEGTKYDNNDNANQLQQRVIGRHKDEWVVCKVFHKNNKGKDNKLNNATATGFDHSSSTSVGTPPNVSSISVDAGAVDDDDFIIDSMIDPTVYLDSISSLPDLTTMDDAAAASSFVDLPCYHTFSNLNQLQPAVIGGGASSTVTPATSSSSYYGSSWNLQLHAGHPAMGSSSCNLHDQATMVRALADLDAACLPSPLATGTFSQHNSV